MTNPFVYSIIGIEVASAEASNNLFNVDLTTGVGKFIKNAVYSCIKSKCEFLEYKTGNEKLKYWAYNAINDRNSKWAKSIENEIKLIALAFDSADTVEAVDNPEKCSKYDKVIAHFDTTISTILQNNKGKIKPLYTQNKSEFNRSIAGLVMGYLVYISIHKYFYEFNKVARTTNKNGSYKYVSRAYRNAVISAENLKKMFDESFNVLYNNLLAKMCNVAQTLFYDIDQVKKYLMHDWKCYLTQYGIIDGRAIGENYSPDSTNFVLDQIIAINKTIEHDYGGNRINKEKKKWIIKKFQERQFKKEFKNFIEFCNQRMSYQLTDESSGLWNVDTLNTEGGYRPKWNATSAYCYLNCKLQLKDIEKLFRQFLWFINTLKNNYGTDDNAFSNSYDETYGGVNYLSKFSNFIYLLEDSKYGFGLQTKNYGKKLDESLILKVINEIWHSSDEIEANLGSKTATELPYEIVWFTMAIRQLKTLVPKFDMDQYWEKYKKIKDIFERNTWSSRIHLMTLCSLYGWFDIEKLNKEQVESMYYKLWHYLNGVSIYMVLQPERWLLFWQYAIISCKKNKVNFVEIMETLREIIENFFEAINDNELADSIIHSDTMNDNQMLLLFVQYILNAENAILKPKLAKTKDDANQKNDDLFTKLFKKIELTNYDKTKKFLNDIVKSRVIISRINNTPEAIDIEKLFSTEYKIEDPKDSKKAEDTIKAEDSKKMENINNENKKDVKKEKVNLNEHLFKIIYKCVTNDIDYFQNIDWLSKSDEICTALNKLAENKENDKNNLIPRIQALLLNKYGKYKNDNLFAKPLILLKNEYKGYVDGQSISRPLFLLTNDDIYYDDLYARCIMYVLKINAIFENGGIPSEQDFEKQSKQVFDDVFKDVQFVNEVQAKSLLDKCKYYFGFIF